MSRPVRIAALLGFLALAAAYLATRKGGPFLPPGGPRADLRTPRLFEGTVHAAGEPLPGARVRLYEDVAGGYVAETTTDGEGRYRIGWTPLATGRTEELFLLASDPKETLAPAVAPAGGAAADLWLEPGVETAGRVIDFEGRPVVGATVTAALEHGRESSGGVSGADGSFRLPGFAPRAPLQVVVRAEGFAPYLEGRFRAGDALLVRLRRGFGLRLKLIDPRGADVAGAAVSLPGPPALATALRLGETGGGGVAELADASPGGARIVSVAAEGYLPAQVSLSPGREELVRLWPAREVAVRYFDARSRAPVEDVAFEVELMPPGGSEAWHGDLFGTALRSYPERYGPRLGERILLLPRCRLQLSCSSADYSDRHVMLDAESRSASVRLTGSGGGDASARVRLFAAGFAGRLPIVVGEEESGWVSSAVLAGGATEIEVPAGRPLQVASPGACASGWMPRLDLEPLRPRSTREVRVALRPAVRLEIATDPPVDGLVRYLDTGSEKLVRPEEAVLRRGSAELWVRPHRRTRVEVRPHSNHAVKEFDVAVEQKAARAVVALLPAAGFRAEVVDLAGAPVPFARARFWAPDVTGRPQMGREPIFATADAGGLLSLLGHAGGSAVIEVGAPGFRSRWFAGVPLEASAIEDAGEIRLEPAARVRGVLVDREGGPVAHAYVRVLAPSIARLKVGADREMDAYDLTTEVGEEGVSRANGSFEVEDSTPRAPLLGVIPGERPDLGPTPFLIIPGQSAFEMPPVAYLQLVLPGSATGVFLVLPGGRAVRVQNDPPIAVRPLPVLVPSGMIDLLVLLRDGRWAAQTLSLAAGEHREIELTFRR